MVVSIECDYETESGMADLDQEVSVVEVERYKRDVPTTLDRSKALVNVIVVKMSAETPINELSRPLGVLRASKAAAERVSGGEDYGFVNQMEVTCGAIHSTRDGACND